MSLVLPYVDTSLLIRTQFGDDSTWRRLCAAALAPSIPDGFTAYLECIDDRRFDGLSVDQAAVADPPDGFPEFVFLADRRAQQDQEHPVLVVDRYQRPGRHFRVIPSQLWSVENNLSLSNMDFEEFAESTDPNGIFRGF